MKFFIAGRWTDKERVRQLMDEVISQGHTITRDWTVFDAASDDAPLLREYSIGDIEGVRQADIFVLLADQDFQFRGAYAELGAAIAWEKPIYIIGSFANKCIHTYHPLVKQILSIKEILDEPQ